MRGQIKIWVPLNLETTIGHKEKEEKIFSLLKIKTGLPL